MANVEVKGLAELGEAMKQFPIKIAQKYLRKATFGAADVIKQEVIARAPVRTGALRNAIAIFKRPSDGDTAHYAVGVRGIKLKKKFKKVARLLAKSQGVKRLVIEGDTFYARFLEFGTSKMAPRPFLRPAFETKKQDSIERFRILLSDGVQKAADEVRSKG